MKKNLTLGMSLLALALPACQSGAGGSSKKLLQTLAPKALEDSVETPAHGMAPSEYPFDKDGRYVLEWVEGGKPTVASAEDLDTHTPGS